MTKVKRCPFCGRKLDTKGHCQNKKCPDYKRTQILEEQKQGEESKP